MKTRNPFAIHARKRLAGPMHNTQFGKEKRFCDELKELYEDHLDPLAEPEDIFEKDKDNA